MLSPEWGRGAESPPSPCAHAAGDAAQGMVGLLGCQCTLLGHVLISQHPQVLLRASPPSLYLLETALTQMQDLALSLAELPLGLKAPWLSRAVACLAGLALDFLVGICIQSQSVREFG